MPDQVPDQVKEKLFTPGPVEVKSSYSLAMAAPMMHHRSEEFSDLFQSLRKGLKYLFQTEQDVLVLSSSGTGAMEAAVSNFFSPSEKVVVICAGKFGERWAEIASVFGLDVKRLEVPWGEAVDVEVVRAVLDREGEVAGLFVQACETSTGVKHPVEELSQLVRDRDLLFVVDGVSAVGAFDLPFDRWKLDVLVSGSQKAIAISPGLSFLSASDRAWEKAESSIMPKYYFDLLRERKSQRKGQTAYTPNVSLCYALKERLKDIEREGLSAVFARHSLYSQATRSALQGLGVELFASDAPAETLTSAKVPAGIDGVQLVRYLSESCGVRVAGGQGDLKGKIFRVGHIGDLTRVDVLSAISAVEMGLSHFGFDLALGAGVRVAEKFFDESFS